MMHSTPPRSICFSLDVNKQNDDASEITVPCHGDEDTPLAREGSLGVEPAPDNGGSEDAGEHQELLRLRLRLSRQRERLLLVSAKLGRYEVENQELRAERKALVDELAATKREPPDTRRRPFSNQGWNGGGGSLNMLIDMNAKLMNENARLEVVADVVRKSFLSYIKEARANGDRNRRAIENLQREKEFLQQRLGVSKNLGSSTRTAKDSLESSVTGPLPMHGSRRLPEDHKAESSLDPSLAKSFLAPTLADKNPEKALADKTPEEEGSIEKAILRNSLRSIPEKGPDLGLGTSGDDWLIEGEDIELDDSSSRRRERDQCRPPRPPKVHSLPDELAKELEKFDHAKKSALGCFSPAVTNGEGLEKLRGKFAEDAARYRSGLLVDFGEGGGRRPSRTILPRRLSRSHNDGTRSAHNLAGVPGELLVEFGERGRRLGSLGRRWSSMKL